MIPNHLETERFDLLHDDTVCVADYGFGHNRRGKRDVWIERSAKHERFLSQITSEGETYTVRKEIYTKQCYFCARRRLAATTFSIGMIAASGCTGARFSGAETFFGDESVKIQKWLAGNAD